MKCEICGKDILKDSQCIDYRYYHNDCIINLTKENKQLKEHIEKYEHYCKTTGIEELMQKIKKYKEVIDKAINNSQYWIDFYTKLNSDERIALRLQENIDILKEVE